MEAASRLIPNSVGICLGASTFSLVEIASINGKIEVVNKVIVAHDGDPKGTFTRIIDAYDLAGKSVSVTGRKFRDLTTFPSLIEPEATEIAYQHLYPGAQRFDAVVSAGGESFLVYEMDKKGRVSRISSGNKCASGTGEFFLQQIRRMNIGVEEAISLARQSKNPHQLSGRCSVFCKSDCTHALNKGEPIGDVAAGLGRMIAKKIEELLVKVNAKKVLLVGGTAQNGVVVDFLQKTFPQVEVPDHAPCFEALGAAIYALKNKLTPEITKNNYFKDIPSSFEQMPALSKFVDKVEFKDQAFETARDGDVCVVGLDVGSTTTKAVLLRRSDETIVAAKYLRTNGNPIEASRQCYRALIEQLGTTRVTVVGLGVTGSGRYLAGLHADTEGIINEIIAHARAAAHFDPEVDTIFEIGGQDAKYTLLTNGVASDYAMNEACSAGTGSFLEESAYESMGVKMEDIAPIALAATNPPNFSDQCAAFISSDINMAFQEGISRENIIAGLVYSICINYVNRVKGFRQVGKKIFMQGGVCYNKAVPIAMAALTGKSIIVPPHPGLMGAYGVALEVGSLLDLGLLAPREFDLGVLAEREVTPGKSFVCMGRSENCDRRCEISMIEIEGKKFPFGGACNKYYNQLHHLKYDTAELNHVAKRRELLFHPWVELRTDLPADAPLVGLNRSFQIHTLYPLYSTFFNQLGCRIVLPTEVRQTGIDKAQSSLCLSAQVAMGLFEDLLDKKPDYIFMPQLKELHVSEQKDYRIEYQTVCMFVQGEPFYQKSSHFGPTATRATNLPKMITPSLNLMKGWGAGAEVFAQVAVDMGFTREQGLAAHTKAAEAQTLFFEAMKAQGRRILAKLESDPSRTAVVLFGRPYNAFAEETNKGVPSKFASRGVELIPYDFLDYESEENYKNTYWEMGQRIIKGARIVERHPQLFGTFLTNFLCALDSMMVQHFRDLMGTKPSLTIEVDSHTADAGVNTRIEAFMDVIQNYLKVRGTGKVAQAPFRAATVELDNLGKAVFVGSGGEKLRMDTGKVKVLVPSMGDLFNRGAAAVFRDLGWNAEALPVCDREALDLGRSVTTSKECLPIINIVGELMKYLKYRTDPDEKLVMMIVGAGGCCRVGQYDILLRTTVEKLHLPNVATMKLSNDDGYAGLGLKFRLNMVKSMYAFDVLDDIRNAVKALAVDREAAMTVLNAEIDKVVGSVDGTNKTMFYTQLRKTARVLRTIPLKTPISQAKYIGLVGEIFVRRDHFSLMGIPDLLADKGFVLLDAPVSEWVRYTDFLRDIGMYELQTNLVGKFEMAASDLVQDHHEAKVKDILATSGLYEKEMIDIQTFMDHSKHIFPFELTGEPGLSTGAALHHLAEKFCGVLNVGPFGCMNSRMTEAVSTIEMTVEGKEEAGRQAGRPVDLSALKESTDILPFLSLECDGNPFSQIIRARLETFILQAERLHEAMAKR
ncbi:MAG: acyl-CoA dehydratase activase [Spirochaetales bacterium]